jgi:hypothetical protein
LPYPYIYEEEAWKKEETKAKGEYQVSRTRRSLRRGYRLGKVIDALYFNLSLPYPYMK